MRFAIACLLLLCVSPVISAGVVPLGGDPIGPDSSTTDGYGAMPASRLGTEEHYLGQPGVAFSLEGTKRLITLRSIVTFRNRNGGPLDVSNQRFRARLWSQEDYLADKPFLREIELGAPEGVEFQTLSDGSVVPAQSFGAAEGDIPRELPSYDFRWDLSSHSAFASPLPAGNYVLTLYSLSEIDTEGECLVGITHEPTGLLPVYFSNRPSEFGPGYWNSACCPCSQRKWAIALYVQEEECGCQGQSNVWGSIHGIGVGDSAGTSSGLLLGSLGNFADGSPGLGGFPISSSGGSMPPLLSTGSSDFTPVRFLPDDPLMFDQPRDNLFSFDSSSDFSDEDDTPLTTPTPEPSSILLLALGALILLALNRAKPSFQRATQDPQSAK